MKAYLFILFLTASLSADYLVKYNDTAFYCGTDYKYSGGSFTWQYSVNGSWYSGDGSFVPVPGFMLDPNTNECVLDETIEGMSKNQFTFAMALAGVLSGFLFGLFIWKAK